MNKPLPTYEGKEYGGVHIRDNVHGDIIVPYRFLPIVDAYAFQRLRRVKQLATAQYAFPSADHSRFTHSLGTFYVMQRIIAHFERYFQELGLPEFIDRHEEDMLLIASLLHDLGHTPFSHALEDALPNAKKIPHERWTTDIITDTNGELFKIIETFGEGSAKEVADIILMHQEPEGDPFFPAQAINMRNIFHSLISSQIDADRLDYIRRDSISTGVSYGLIDIDRLISGLQIGVFEDGNAIVCIAEKNLPDVEGYLYARYQMYRNVYLKPFKMLTEELLRKIIRCVYELYDHDRLKSSDLPLCFKNALQKPAMSIDDFLSLDDYVIMGAIKGWTELTDKRAQILRELCRCLIYRTGYTHYTFVDVRPDTLHFFKEELVALLKSYMLPSLKKMYRSEDAWIAEFPFLVLKVEYPQLYKTGKDNIYIIENSGRLVEIPDCSKLVRSFLPPSGTEEEPNEKSRSAVSAIYYNPEMLNSYLKQETIFRPLDEKEIVDIKEEVKRLFDRRKARNSIEIEKKYFVRNAGNWTQIKELLCRFLIKTGYTISAFPPDKDLPLNQVKPRVQTDYYLDTEDAVLFEKQCSLRVRVRGNKAEITCKRPVDGSRSCGKLGQMERYEYAGTLKNCDISQGEQAFRCEEGRQFVDKFVRDLVDFEKLDTVIVVKNERLRYLVEKKPLQSDSVQAKEKYELSFDSVTYTNPQNGQSYSEHQIELELKSEPVTRLNMQNLTNNLERELHKYQLEVMTDSKYERARYFTRKV